KSKRLLMSLLEAQSLDDVVIVLQDSFRNDFRVEFCSLVLFGEPERFPASSLHLIPEELACEQLGTLLETQRAICGRFQAEQLALLFPTHHAKIGSAAVIPLRYGDVLGMLSLGSDDLDYFDSSLGSLVLSYLRQSLS